MELLSFRWVVRGRLAGCARPGRFEPLERDLETLTDHGIDRLVSLTQEPLDLPPSSSIETSHFPISDMAAPMRHVAVAACSSVLDGLEADKAVAVHCRAGVGRTGTILACVLTLADIPVGRAMAQLRGINAHYVQTSMQEAFIEHWAEEPPAELVERARALKSYF